MLLDQLSQATTLFGLGMGTVFVLLSLVITCVSLLSAACQKFEKTPVHTALDINAKEATRNTQISNVTEQEKAIVISAIHAHRQAKGL